MSKIVVFIVTILTVIGDTVIFLFLLPWRGFQFLRRKFVHKKRQSVTTSFPIRTKLKYFFLGSIFSFLFLFLPLCIVIVIQSLPNPNQLSLNFAPQTTKIYDRNGILLYQVYASQNRTVVPLSSIPPYLQQATIAIEDKNFYKNPGFDIQAIIRAAVSDIRGGSFQGGSTITQQLIKSSLLTPRVSFDRKIQEVILAFWAEKMYTKNQILTMYFNQVPYGGTAWGVESAAQTYFDKSVKDLDLAESAFLAGMPQAPSVYSPFSDNPGLWKKRQTEVLNRMSDLGFISAQQKQDALQEELHFKTPQIPLLAPHFVMYVKKLLEDKYGLALVEKGGLKVITSLDLKTQDMAQKIVATEVSHDTNLNLTNGAAVITNPKNGDILAMVGSADYNNPTDGNVNVTTALRQPGSSIKLVTYSAALSHGFTAATMLDDSPVSYSSSGGPTYTPVNYDGKFHGQIPLRIAFGNSFNIPAVKTLNTIGLKTFVDLARKMGISHIKDAENYGLSATLGGVDATMVDMATAYGTIANQGSRVDLNPFLKITDNTDTVLEEKVQPQEIPVLDKGIAFIIANILADNTARSMEFGTNSPLVIPNYTASVKTGTSDDKRDNWTIGFTPSILTAVWVGNNDNSPMSPTLASGITGAAPIWHNIMVELLKDKPNETYTQPDNVIAKPCLGHTEYFIKGTETNLSCIALPTWTPTPSK